MEGRKPGQLGQPGQPAVVESEEVQWERWGVQLSLLEWDLGYNIDAFPSLKRKNVSKDNGTINAKPRTVA